MASLAYGSCASFIHSQAAARRFVVVAVRKLDKILEQRVTGTSQVQEVVNVLCDLILRFCAVLLTEHSNQTQEPGWSCCRSACGFLAGMCQRGIPNEYRAILRREAQLGRQGERATL